MHGRYPIAREQSGVAHVKRSNGQSLRRTEEVKLPLEEHITVQGVQKPTQSGPGLSVELFIESIRAAVDANHRRPGA
jgi:hypothetical protein